MLDKNINLQGNSDVSKVKKENLYDKRAQAKDFSRPYKGNNLSGIVWKKNVRSARGNEWV